MSQFPKWIHCPECQWWLRIDPFNGMHYCPNIRESCSVAGNYLTQDEVRQIVRNEQEATDAV